MAEIKVNKGKFVNGKLTIERQQVEDEDGELSIVTKGVFVTHDYFEEIDTLESERYLLQGIKVYKETFGSNDYNIGYEFLASNLIIKDDYIPYEIKALIESFDFKEEEAEYFHSKNWEKALDIYESIIRKIQQEED